MSNLPMKSRLHRLESEMAKLLPVLQPVPVPIDFDAIIERMERRAAREKAIEAEPDPMARYKYWLSVCAEKERSLNATFIPRPGYTVNLGPQLAAISLPRNQYRLRAAELELLHAAGFDTTELQASHDKANYFNWRHQPLPTAAQTLLVCNFTEKMDEIIERRESTGC